jgi:hypothetical protein
MLYLYEMEDNSKYSFDSHVWYIPIPSIYTLFLFFISFLSRSGG